MGLITKEWLVTEFLMGRGLKNMKMEINIMEISNKVTNKDKEFINLPMVSCMRGNLNKEILMGEEKWPGLMEIGFKDNSKIT